MPSTIPTTGTTGDEQDKEPQPVTGAAREPALIRGLVVSAVSFAVAFGADLNSDQQASTIDLVSFALVILAPIIGAWWTRRHVTPTVTVAASVDKDGVTRSGPADQARPNGAPVTVRPAATTAAAATVQEDTHA